MAKQSGPVFITGTVAGICYYKLNGKFYARRASTLSRKRVKNAPAFALTRKYASLMAEASKLAAEVYRPIPRSKRKHALYRAMTGQAMTLLKKGVDKAEISKQLELMREKAIAVRGSASKPVVRMRAAAGGMSVVKTVWRRRGIGMQYGEIADKPQAQVWTVITPERTYQVRMPDVRCSSS